MGGIGQGRLGAIPGGIITRPYIGAVGKFNPHIIKPKISINGLQQCAEFNRLFGNLIFGTKNMRIILGKGTHPHNSVQCT